MCKQNDCLIVSQSIWQNKEMNTSNVFQREKMCKNEPFINRFVKNIRITFMRRISYSQLFQESLHFYNCLTGKGKAPGFIAWHVRLETVPN